MEVRVLSRAPFLPDSKNLEVALDAADTGGVLEAGADGLHRGAVGGQVVVKEEFAGGDADLKSETLMIIGESARKESVTAVKAELEAVAGGSDKGLAAEAKLALEMIE